ncbi:MAG TPA: hypothetical protein VFR43_08455, partial [Gaiellaceae bacterium]|nr:hypothetical protein [Gaiellaceae bacterium]
MTGRQPLVGAAVARRAGAALLTGAGRFVADLARPGLLHVRVVRSPLAHARLAAVRPEAALGLPGVVAVL